MEDIKGFDLPDDSLKIQGVSRQLGITAENDTIGRNALVEDEYTDDIESQYQCESLLLQGKEYQSLLYTFRSCSGSLPTVTEELAPRKLEIFQKQFEILHSEISKLVDLMEFKDAVISFFCEEIDRLALIRSSRVISDDLFDSLIGIIDMVVCFDCVKDQKISIVNDFSRYKRAFTICSKDIENSAIISQQIDRLQSFLSNPATPKRIFCHDLRTAVKTVGGNEDVFSDLTRHCIEQLNLRRFVLPDEKYRLLRALPMLLALMDSDEESKKGFNVFKSNKKYSIEETLIWFKRYPVVPVFGDVQYTLVFGLQVAPHYVLEVGEAFGVDGGRIPPQYELCSRWKTCRAQYDNFSAQFALVLNKLRSEANPSFELAQAALDLYVCSVSFRVDSVLEEAAWKFAHPAPVPADVDPTAKGIEYQRAVKYNYSHQDICVLYDFVGLIKGLGCLLIDSETVLAPMLCKTMHDELQSFVQRSIAYFLYKGHKHNRPFQGKLLLLRSFVVDWQNSEDAEQYKTKKTARMTSVKASADTSFLEKQTRVATVRQSVLVRFRSVLKSLFDASSSAVQSRGVLRRRDFDDDAVRMMHGFHHRSFFYRHAMMFSSSVNALTDLGSLWYRELYLEMTRCIQFPISCSIPWILIQNVLEHPSSDGLEGVYYAMDIYNDAAALALTELKQQYLYNEIEAETNLVFDQFLFLLSEMIYKHVKATAVVSMFDIAAKDRLHSLKGEAFLDVQRLRFQSPACVRHLRLLGRSIDVNAALLQHILPKLQGDLECAAIRFESGPLTGIVELRDALKLLKETHAGLAKMFDSLVPFEILYREEMEISAPYSLSGRVTNHCISEVLCELVAKQCYNSATKRFTECEDDTRKTGGKEGARLGRIIFGGGYVHSFNLVHRLYRGFFGVPHLDAMLQVLGENGTAALIEECTAYLTEKFEKEWISLVPKLFGGLPPVKHPAWRWRSGGCYAFFEARLLRLWQYSDLRPAVLQLLREMGNLIAFLGELGEALERRDILTFTVCAPFLEATASPNPSWHGTTGSSVSSFPKTGQRCGLMDGVCSHLNEDDIRVMQNAVDHVERRANCREILQHALSKIAPLWRESNGSSTPLPEAEHCVEFHRLWSALAFILCMPVLEAVPTDAEGDGETDVVFVSSWAEFGDGAIVFGSLLLELLDQRARWNVLDFSRHVELASLYDRLGLSDDSSVGLIDSDTAERCELFLGNARHLRAVDLRVQRLFQVLLAGMPTGEEKMLLVVHPPETD